MTTFQTFNRPYRYQLTFKRLNLPMLLKLLINKQSKPEFNKQQDLLASDIIIWQLQPKQKVVIIIRRG